MPRFSTFVFALFAIVFSFSNANAQCGSHSYISTAPVTRVYRTPSMSYPTPVRVHASAPVRLVAPTIRYTNAYSQPVRPSYIGQPVRLSQTTLAPSLVQRSVPSYIRPSAASMLSRPTCANGTCGR